MTSRLCTLGDVQNFIGILGVLCQVICFSCKLYHKHGNMIRVVQRQPHSLPMLCRICKLVRNDQQRGAQLEKLTSWILTIVLRRPSQAWYLAGHAVTSEESISLAACSWLSNLSIISSNDNSYCASCRIILSSLSVVRELNIRLMKFSRKEGGRKA